MHIQLCMLQDYSALVSFRVAYVLFILQLPTNFHGYRQDPLNLVSMHNVYRKNNAHITSLLSTVEPLYWDRLHCPY